MMSMFHPSRFVPMKDERNPFTLVFELDQQYRCYLEPGFIALLRAIDEREPQHIESIVNEIALITQEHKRVVFALSFESPITRLQEPGIVIELQDVLNRLNIHFHSVNTGSHSGD
jgi:hypothetical protein